MACKQKKILRIIVPVAALALMLAVLCIAAGCDFTGGIHADEAQQNNYELKAIMLDVGQGDSILLASGGQYMLIDAGENDQGDKVVADLKGLGVTKLFAVVGTHPHSDHIGGLDTVIKAFPVGAVYLPGETANTVTYEDVLDAIKGRGLKITVPEPGDRLKLGNADLEFLWPPAGFNSDNVNDCSIVIRASAGGRTVLLCGDIEKDSEKAILDLNEDVGCDVLKVAHHGSDTSSTKNFLKAAMPKYALISVGKNNDYKHPNKDVLQRLGGIGADIHRTDLNGTITVTVADGQVNVQNSK